MPKKRHGTGPQTFKQAQQKLSRERDWFESLLKLTPTYEKFRQENLERISDGYAMLQAFYTTSAYAEVGPKLQKRMRFYPTRAVYDTPPYPEDGYRVELRINLGESDDQIRREFDHLIKHYRKVENVSRGEYQKSKPTKPRGKHHMPDQEKAECMICAYELVEILGSPTKAAKELFPVKSYENSAAKSEIEQVGRWHDTVEELIKDL